MNRTKRYHIMRGKIIAISRPVCRMARFTDIALYSYTKSMGLKKMN